MAKYELGSLYQTTSNKGGGKPAKGEKPDAGNVKVGPNTKKTGSLAGQPKAKQSKKSVTPDFSDR